jgi:ABC-type amino acid transport substrate-binding protein
MMKTLTRGALAAMLLSLASALPAQAKALTEIKFGVDPTYPPFESLSPSGQFEGHLRAPACQMRLCRADL